MPTLAASTRYIAPGVTKIYFAPTIAAYPGAATTGEITAGTDITGEIADIAGFSSQAEFVETPDLSNKFVPKISGRIKAEDSSLTFYASVNGTDIRATLTQGLVGYLVFMDGGNVSGQKMDQFAVTVASVSVLRNVSGSDPIRVKVDFALTKVPAYNLAVP